VRKELKLTKLCEIFFLHIADSMAEGCGMFTTGCCLEVEGIPRLKPNPWEGEKAELGT